MKAIPDMNLREKVLMAPLIFATIFFGVYPIPMFDITAASVENLIQEYEADLIAHHGELDRPEIIPGEGPAPAAHEPASHDEGGEH